jgi:CHAD domain-containing protein
MTKAAHLSSALHQPARLTQNNLHPYRLKVKELRDVLLLSNPHGNKGFLDELGAIKDAIGEWHDSEELVEIAMESLDHGPTCKLIEHLRAERGSRLEHALSLIRRLRKKHPRRSEEEGARRARSSKPDVSLG